MKSVQDDYTYTLLYLTRNVECPDEFIVWAAYSSISTVLRDNVKIEFPSRKTSLFPNMYIMILADSGEQRKSVPLKIAHHLIRFVGNTKLIEGRSSIQGVLKELSKVVMLDNSLKLDGAVGVIYSEEFAASFVQDNAVMPILTDIYDYRDKHPINLKSEDTIILKQVVVSMITATNLSHLVPMLGNNVVTGGFVGRVLIVSGRSYRPKNLDLNAPPQTETWDLVQSILTNVARLRGSAIFKDQSVTVLDTWYDHSGYSKISGTGFESRIHSHVQKVTLSKVAAKAHLYTNRHLRITMESCKESTKEVVTIRHSYIELVTGSTSAVQTTVGVVHTILHYLIKNQFKKVEREELMSSIIRSTDSKGFGEAMETLTACGLIKAVSYNSNIFYEPTTKAIQAYGGSLELEHSA